MAKYQYLYGLINNYSIKTDVLFSVFSIDPNILISYNIRLWVMLSLLRG